MRCVYDCFDFSLQSIPKAETPPPPTAHDGDNEEPEEEIEYGDVLNMPIEAPKAMKSYTALFANKKE